MASLGIAGGEHIIGSSGTPEARKAVVVDFIHDLDLNGSSSSNSCRKETQNRRKERNRA